MRLKYPKSFHKKLGVRLTIWYSGVFLFSSLIFAVGSFLLVFSAVRHNPVAIQAALLQYREKAEGGISALAKLFRQQVHPSRTNSFFDDSDLLVVAYRLGRQIDPKSISVQTE
jgi:hypothetical protein